MRNLALLTACVLLAAGAVHAGDCAVAISTCTQEEIEQIPAVNYANLKQFLQAVPSGFSDFAIVTRGPFPREDPRTPDGPTPLHELLSGELATAVAYDDMTPMWTEMCMRYPEWKTPSTFIVENAPAFDIDLDGDGFNEGWGSVVSPSLRLTTNYDWEDTGTGVAMGRGLLGGLSYQLSDRYVLHLRYELENVSPSTLTGVSFYQMIHAHPANAETPTVDIAYDSTMHMMGAHTAYRYDLTQVARNSGLIDGYPTGSEFLDHVSLSTDMMPADRGLGTYKGHNAGDEGNDPSTGSLKPTVGIHCDVEADALNNADTLLQEEVGGALKWDLGDLAPGATAEIRVMFAYSSEAFGTPAEACLEITDNTGGDPEITMSKGACSDTGAPGGPFDIVTGSLHDLRLAPGCGEDLNCVLLNYMDCMQYGHTGTRFTVPEDAHRLDTMFYLVRESGTPFLNWGLGNAPDAGNPWLRVVATPVTAPNVDACIPMP